MSSYWQGKGAGKKIAIRFTKPLLGDVTGNEDAFTIKGMVRNPLKYGPLTEKTFTVESVERYPIEQYWQDDFSGQMDGVEVGENGVVLEGGLSDEKIIHQEDASGVGATRGNNLNPIGQTFTPNRNLAKFAVEFYIGVTATPSHKLRAYLYNTSSGLPTGSPIATSADIIHSATGWARFEFEINLSSGFMYACVWQATSAEASNLYEVYGDGGQNLYAGGRYTFWDGTAWSDNDLWDTTFRVYDYLEQYSTPGTYTTTTPADTLPADPRLKWTEDLPTGTSITAEYAVNQDALTTPTTWTPINESDLLTIPDPATGYFLWMKFTLATTDTGATPTLLAVWLEEAEAPPDTILLRFDTYNRFNDVEGDLTVTYTQALGTLAGTRPVEDFTESFTPTDLEPTPIDRHDITAGIELEVDFIEVDYRYFKDDSADHIITAGITVEVDLIPVSEIPP